MRKDAEAHAAEDEKRHAEVEDRNKADGLAFQVEKTLKDAGDKIAADKKAPVEAALKELKDLLAKQNPAAPIDEIKAKQDALMKAMEPVAQEMYAAGQAQQGAQPGAGTPPPNQEPPKNEKKGGDDVVDADFTMK